MKAQRSTRQSVLTALRHRLPLLLVVAARALATLLLRSGAEVQDVVAVGGGPHVALKLGRHGHCFHAALEDLEGLAACLAVLAIRL